MKLELEVIHPVRVDPESRIEEGNVGFEKVRFGPPVVKCDGISNVKTYGKW